MKKGTKRMLKKILHLNTGKMNTIVDIKSKENNKSKLHIKIDMFLSFVKYGTGYTDYFRGNFINLKSSEKKTFATARNFYKVIHYFNNKDYVCIFHDKLLFNKLFEKYLNREYINLKVSSIDDFKAFLAKHDVVFAKDPYGEGGHGIEKIVVTEINDQVELYNKLLNNKQFLVEEAIIQSSELNEINPKVVNSFRVVTLVKDGKAYIVNNALRVNQLDSDVIGCTNDVYFSFNEDGIIDSNVIDDFGNIYENHPLTNKKFSEVKVPDVKKAFEICKEAAMIIPEVRYVGWDIAFSKNGPLIVEGNEYPGYGILQFYKLKGSRTGHLKEIENIIGDEIKQIKI